MIFMDWSRVLRTHRPLTAGDALCFVDFNIMPLLRRVFLARSANTSVLCLLLSIHIVSCQSSEVYAPPPEGVPDTPYWYMAGDSVQWYMPAETLMMAQMTVGANAQEVSKQLFALRDLGWRMTVSRGPALRRPNDDQSLEQTLFQLERTVDAVSPTTERGRFADMFWKESTPGIAGALHSVMPALRLLDDSAMTYLWPGYVGIVWSGEPTAAEATSLLDSLECRTITTPQQIFGYFVHKTWAVELPAGSELFSWLRMFNKDSRVQLAVPITAGYDPPAADQRLVRRFKGKYDQEPEEFGKLDAPVKQAFYTAHFSESAAHVTAQTRLITRFNLFKLVILTERSTAAEDEALLKEHEGEIISRSHFRIEAWIPYENIPALVMEPTVTQIQPARK